MKYGLLPRQHDQAIPHYSSIRTMRAVQIPPLPFEMSNDTLPDDVGVKLNDRYGCCAIAGPFTFMQITVKQAMGSLLQIPDNCVLQAYEEVGGYQPSAALADGSNPTDGGCALQDVLKYWLNVGFPMPDGSRHKILGFVEVDPRDKQDMCEVAMECGAVLIGMDVPRLLPEDPGSDWGAGGLGPIEGRHCVILPQYRDPASPTFGVRSWGSKYNMLPPFDHNVDEAYGVIDPYFIGANGRTPWGLDLEAWQSLMQAIKAE